MALMTIAFPGFTAESEATRDTEVVPVNLQQCLVAALLNNRDLQIERLNPRVAKFALDESYGYYDPLLLIDARRENTSDSGGFDPTDFSRDAVYEAESHVGVAALTGFLPGGLNYTLEADYANSFGFRNGLDFDSYRLRGGVTARQPLLKNFWIDQGRMTIRINKRNLRITELNVTWLTMDIINQVRQAYVDLQLAESRHRVTTDLLVTRRRTLQAVTRQMEGGVMSMPDHQLAMARAAAVETDWLVDSNEVLLAVNVLRALMGDSFKATEARIWRTADSLLAIPESFDAVESRQNGLALRPDLAQMREAVERARIDLRFRRNQLFPALDIVAGYRRQGASVRQVPPPLPAEASVSEAWNQIRDGSAPSDMVGVVLSVPLGRISERASYRAGKSLLEQADLRVRQMEERVFREVSDAMHTARIAWSRVASARQARDLAQAAVAAEEKRLLGGSSTLFILLDLQDNAAAARSAEYEAVADYNKAVAQLRLAEGTLLEHHRIQLDIR